MTNKIFLSISFIVFLSFNSSAQLEKTLHQTFSIDETDVVTLELRGDSIHIINWAGNSLLTETKIELYGASPSILKHFINKENRYQIESDTTAGALKLYSTDQERKPIRTRSGECPEIVYIKVFVPENFEINADQKLVRIN